MHIKISAFAGDREIAVVVAEVLEGSPAELLHALSRLAGGRLRKENDMSLHLTLHLLRGYRLTIQCMDD